MTLRLENFEINPIFNKYISVFPYNFTSIFFLISKIFFGLNNLNFAFNSQGLVGLYNRNSDFSLESILQAAMQEILNVKLVSNRSQKINQNLWLRTNKQTFEKL